MNLFYTPFAEQNQALFEEDESMHIIKVLRMKQGDTIEFTDGKGNYYKGRIAHAHQKKMLVEVIEKTPKPILRNYHIHLAIAPTKNMDRIEWLVEKATELGIDTISPIICQRSERREIKTERLQKVAVSAMKQSLKFYLPQINQAAGIKEFLKQNHAADIKCIAHCIESEKKAFVSLLKDAQKILIAIGPEGDFTPEEIQQAVENNFLPVSLGNERLRTETAGLAAVSAIHTIKNLSL